MVGKNIIGEKRTMQTAERKSDNQDVRGKANEKYRARDFQIDANFQ